MDYKLNIKPANMKSGQKYKIIQVTNIMLHTAKKTPTQLVGKKIQQAFDSNIQDRIYSDIERAVVSDNRSFTIELLKMNQDFVRMVKEEESKGYKVLIGLPNSGIPVVAGSDTIEFLNSKNGRRVVRGLSKENNKKK